MLIMSQILKLSWKFATQNMGDDDIYNAMQNIFSGETELDEIDEEFDEIFWCR